ncbi:Putative two-domain glycosyltransferase [hydrothermal vent metagenome]|uniref:Two-domain glycosyltransferase n=1 Tax=hydrothermal vent metagenome TaxID=652676 RepID=A0A3B1CNA6_9ZZZZ
MNSKNKISAVIITKNEELNIERCLKSIQWVDEIVVVDSNSTDKTIEICNRYNCKVINSEWFGFGRTKKLAVDSASNNWILSIDSDEEVTQELESTIKEILKDPKFNGYKIKRKSYYLGKMINHCGWNSDYPLRLFNREFGNFNEKNIHESINVKGKVGQIETILLHYTYPTISSHIIKLDKYTELQARELKKKGRHYSLFAVALFSIYKFINMYFLHLGFLDGKEGFVLCSNSAYGVYLKYLKLWELNLNNGK